MSAKAAMGVVDDPAQASESDSESKKKGKLKKNVYEAEFARLQCELVKLQEWIKHQKLKVVVVFEGRDAAGKGG